jgi:hypothetical protein
MSVLEALISADRVVIIGLDAYDKAMANAWEIAAEAMAKDGVPADQIEAAKEGHDARALRGRGNLHPELWKKAMAMIVTLDEPPGGAVA